MNNNGKTDDDEVLAKFIRYMEKTLLHKRLNYIRDNKKKNKIECSIEGLENTIYSENEIDIDIDINKIEIFSEKEKKVIQLHIKDKLTYKEIANIMNLQPESIRKIKYRAFKKLESRGYLYENKNKIS